MKFYFFIISMLFIAACRLHAEDEPPVQTVKGKVLNFRNQQPLPGAVVRIIDTKFGTYSENDGTFRIDNVPAGRYRLRASAVGFDPQTINITVNSGRQVKLRIQLNERAVEMQTVEVTGSRGSFESINEAAVVSSTVFDLDDVEKFAGSRMDPARMAQNYAGVVGANDQRNDIIIRGGSPTELLWRLDGLDIPNPNHFATQGATGGPINAINTLMLDDSDFLTGAFPAEYGDKMSGVFDLRTRRGNYEKYEFIAQAGFNGFEAGAEGPVPGIKGSFIANYRYSFLDLLNKMGMDLKFTGVPRYQDAMFKFDADPSPSHHLSLTGLWGTSEIFMQKSDDNDVVTGDQDLLNGTDIFTLGLNWKYLASEEFYTIVTAGTVYGKFRTDIDSLTVGQGHEVISIDKWLRLNSVEGYHTLKIQGNYSPAPAHFITAGIESRQRYYELFEKRYDNDRPPERLWHLDKEGTAIQFLNFANWNWQLNREMTLNLGIHSQYLEISGKSTVEPRAGFSYNFLPRHSVNFGFGVHRQSLPLLIYFSELENEDLDFMQSIHYIAGYNYMPAEDLLIGIEAYYKDLSKIPVNAEEEDSWSMINQGTDFGSVRNNGNIAKSTGTGRAYGAEFSVTKNFSNGYYITTNVSYIRQQYKGSDGIMRFGAFDNIYVLNLLAGYEIMLSDAMTLSLSGKYILAGGPPYSPIDTARSDAEGYTYYIDEQAYSMRKPDYSKIDAKIELRHNMQGVAVISFFSFENIFSRQNVLSYQYDDIENEIETVYQPGFFFVGGVRVEF